MVYFVRRFSLESKEKPLVEIKFIVSSMEILSDGAGIFRFIEDFGSILKVAETRVFRMVVSISSENQPIMSNGGISITIFQSPTSSITNKIYYILPDNIFSVKTST